MVQREEEEEEMEEDMEEDEEESLKNICLHLSERRPRPHCITVRYLG